MLASLILTAVLGQTPIYQEIRSPEPVRHRQEVAVAFERQGVTVKTTIPVINGWLPQLTEYPMADGSLYRILDYSQRIPYNRPQPKPQRAPAILPQEEQIQKAPDPIKEDLPLVPMNPEDERMKSFEEMLRVKWTTNTIF